MLNLKNYITSLHSHVKDYLHELFKGWLLAIHIDTRAIEFNSGLIAIAVGIMLTFPPADPYPEYWLEPEYWGWIYIVWGFFCSLFATYGPFAPRRYAALVGVYLWILLTVLMFEGHHTVDKIWIAVIPYIMMIGSSMFTYMGLWRGPSRWNYYESDRSDRL